MRSADVRVLHLLASSHVRAVAEQDGATARKAEHAKHRRHGAAVLPLCLVGFPPDWVLLSAGGYCVALEAALAFYLQRSLADILGKTAVVKPKAVEAADAVKDPAARPAATGPFGQ